MLRAGLSFARMTVAAAAGASCLLVAACGGISASSLSMAPSATSTADPLVGLTARKVATEALANLKAASSLMVAGTVTDSGQSYALNLAIKRGHGCAGTIGEGSNGSFKLIIIGKTIYIDADARFWKSMGGSAGSAASALFNGRYIKTSTTASGMSSIASLCDLADQMGGLTGTFTKGKLTTIAGRRVLPIVNPGQGVLYVTDTSEPEVVETVPTKNNGGGKVTFSVGVPVTLTAPPASQVIDGSALGL